MRPRRRYEYTAKPRKLNKDGTPRAKPRQLEHIEQVQVAKWLDNAGVLYCSVPNAGIRPGPIGNKMKAEGMKPGVPDLLIFTPPPHGIAKGVAVEMKQIDGGEVSVFQHEWHESLRALGWIVIVAHGAADALRQLNALGYRVPG